ncbi:NupC/NupG family nucleoside CNT transporter [Domibacillus sp. PGB-M46]|uniref:NupC/NupG family nucleoside CNT transporter n=1 Tax=Domibacillus sp. PGB-M46 TaxID=2910255 RepID=UPI001F58CC74|nr:nucleoside transporter C-terminal domain-containing protein [Domibacillus sp. PGB-M46]MCI2255280.1 NupC/NupG family nucleoside CNT transporter [Domibacillus sp. PGB-M46]
MTSILVGIVGIILTFGTAYLLSNDKKNINYRAIGILFVLQLAVAAFMLNTNIGGQILKAVAAGFAKIMMFGNEGINFVLGGLVPEGQTVFFINVLLLIVFTSTLLSILNYIRILPLIIKYLGGAIAKLTGLPRIQSFSVVTSSIFGDTGAIVAIKNQLPSFNLNQLFVATTASMTSVSASIVAAYMTMIPAEYVLVALPLNIMSGLILATIVAPVKEENVDVNISEMVREQSLFEAIGNGAVDGIKVAGIVAAMLIAYVSLLAMINYGIEGVTGMKLETILGYVLSPVAIVMGVPIAESVQAGAVMATKILANEFVAMLGFAPLLDTLTAKTVGIVSVFLISFANFASIGIIQGTVQSFSQEQGARVAGFGLKMLLVATMASVLSATIVGLFL